MAIVLPIKRNVMNVIGLDGNSGAHFYHIQDKDCKEMSKRF